MEIGGRRRQLQTLQDLRLDRGEGGGRTQVDHRVGAAQALRDQAERGEGGDQLGAGDGQVVAALGPQAGEGLVQSEPAHLEGRMFDGAEAALDQALVL
jgi:hypothetical protein